MAKREHPRYENTEWPDYEFHEFPMMVYPGSKDGGKTPDRHPTRPGVFEQEAVTVHNEEERRQALGLDEEVGSDAAILSKPLELLPTGKGTSRVKTANDERQELIERLTTAGVQHDKSWSVGRLQDAWDTHEAEGV